ncbi:MAG: FG-GAP repeat protein, partial [Sedimentisphaerales bacterium]|nr:FG-GAP repeat protein [Sedimentisphaerales bacterium]
MKKKTMLLIILILATSAAAQATTFDVAADFSATNNPNGVWSYGWSSTLTSALNLYPDKGKLDPTINIDVWFDWGVLSSYSPNVAHNPTESINNDHWTITWQPWQFSLHPGDSGEYSHARWTAPDAGTIDIASTFTGIDHYFGTTTDVHVLHNGISLFNGMVNGFGNTSSFSTTVSVCMGDIIDFAVGYGSNQTHTCDTTALAATIIPEPPDCWQEQQKLLASDGAAGDFFGSSVAVSGDYMIVGANKGDGHELNTGSAYIFKYDGANWVQQCKLIAPDGAGNDYFGYAVCINENPGRPFICSGHRHIMAISRCPAQSRGPPRLAYARPSMIS